MISSLNPTERAPYRAVICTTRDVCPYEISISFNIYYENYFNLLNITEALKALQENVKDENGYSPFQMLVAEEVFDETFNPNRTISNSVNGELLKELHDKFYDYYNFKDLY